MGGCHEGGTHGAPDVLELNRLSPEARVGRRVLGEHGDLLLERLVGYRRRDVLDLETLQPGPREPCDQLAAVFLGQKDGDPVHPHDLERDGGDGVEQAVEIELARELLGDGEQQ